MVGEGWEASHETTGARIRRARPVSCASQQGTGSVIFQHTEPVFLKKRGKLQRTLFLSNSSLHPSLSLLPNPQKALREGLPNCTLSGPSSLPFPISCPVNPAPFFGALLLRLLHSLGKDCSIPFRTLCGSEREAGKGRWDAQPGKVRWEKMGSYGDEVAEETEEEEAAPPEEEPPVLEGKRME